MKRRYARIVATGSALPGRVVTNDQLARELAGRGIETSDEWIVARTGIRQRYIAEPGVGSAELGARAALTALQSAELGVDSVDLIQLHNLVEPDEWELAHGPDGALAALVQARGEGLVRFIGVTGHGTRIPGVHLRSLAAFDYDSVLSGDQRRRAIDLMVCTATLRSAHRPSSASTSAR